MDSGAGRRFTGGDETLRAPTGGGARPPTLRARPVAVDVYVNVM
jgi:hypothetical protein